MTHDLEIQQCSIEVVEMHIRAKFHRAKFCCLRVLVLTEKKLSDDAENHTAVVSANSENSLRIHHA